MAGRRVRCKNCGETFQIPRVSGGDDEFDQLAELEKTFGGDPSLRTHTSDEQGESQSDEAGEEGGDSDGEERSPLDYGRRSEPLPIAGANIIDSLLPPALVILSLLMIWASSGVDPQHYGITGIRFGVALFCFALIISPITNAFISKAAASLGYQLPPSAKWRGFASYLPAFALAIVFWNTGDGSATALLLGGFLGVAVATAFLFLLFRLRPAEIAPSTTYAAGGFFIGLIVAGGIVFGLDVLTKNLLISNKKTDISMTASPMGPGLPWITESDRLAALPPKSPTTKGGKTTPIVSTVKGNVPPAVVDPNAKTTPTTPSTSTLVLSNDPTPIPVGFDQVIRPLTDSPFLAVVRRKDNTDTVELWNNNTWTPRGTAVLSRDEEHPYVLSGDGERIARIVSFPRASILISGFSADRPVETRDLTQQGTPQLIGFAGESKLLVRWQQDDKCAIEVVDAVSHQKSRLIQTPWFDVKNNTLAVAADGSMAAVAAKIDNLPTLAVFDLATGFAVAKETIKSLDPRWPVAPRGFSFSPDAKKFAILFEQTGAALVICYSVDRAKGGMFEVTEHVYPAGPIPGYDARNFNGDALSWMPDNKSWLLYGTGVFELTSGRQVGDLGVQNVQDAHVVVPDTVELLLNSSNQRSLTALKLNGANLTAITAPVKTQ